MLPVASAALFAAERKLDAAAVAVGEQGRRSVSGDGDASHRSEKARAREHLTKRQQLAAFFRAIGGKETDRLRVY